VFEPFHNYYFQAIVMGGLKHLLNMEVSREIKVWAEKNTVCIQVNPFYTYYAKVLRIGNFEDEKNVPSMWGWIKHLKDKVWWNKDIEGSFIDLCSLMYD
jgi:hypothetical protein